MDNLELIKDILLFDQPDDFYQLYIMVRRKDFPQDEKHLHKNDRIIKSYCIESFEYLEMRWTEIKKLADLFNGRVYIEINPKNHKDVSFQMIEELGSRLKKDLFKQKGIFDISLGSVNSRFKRWIIDVDIKDIDILKEISEYIETLEPKSNSKSKVLACLPTKNGYHLITNRFDTRAFYTKWANHKVEIKKNALTLIYHNSYQTDVMFSLPDVRNKLSPIKNLIAMFENGLAKGNVEMHELVLKEIEECKKSIAYLSGNGA